MLVRRVVARTGSAALLSIVALNACALDADDPNALTGRTSQPRSSQTASPPGDDPGEAPAPPGTGERSPPGSDAPTPAPSSTSTSTSTSKPADAPPPGFDAFQKKNLDLLNAYRASKGIGPLTLDAKLSTFAYAGSQELASDHQPHQRFLDGASSGAIFAAGFSAGGAENQGSPYGWPVMASDPTNNELSQIDSIVQAMMGEGPSGGHYQNIMNPAFRRVGVGLLEVGGQLYLTNDFSP